MRLRGSQSNDGWAPDPTQRAQVAADRRLLKLTGNAPVDVRNVVLDTHFGELLIPVNQLSASMTRAASARSRTTKSGSIHAPSLARPWSDTRIVVACRRRPSSMSLLLSPITTQSRGSKPSAAAASSTSLVFGLRQAQLSSGRCGQQ